MDITCLYCSRLNPAQSIFCVGCGKNISQGSQGARGNTGTSSQDAGPTEITPQPSYGPASASPFLNPMPSQAQYSGGANPPTYAPGGPTSSQPQYTGGPNPPTYAPSNPSAFPPYTTGNVPMPPSQTQWSKPASAPPPPAPQYGSAHVLGSLRRAFAGYGQLIMHHSWLLPGDQAQAMAVRHAIQTKIGQRNIPRLTINSSNLNERGLLMEEREYLITQRGITTVFIYATPAGSDLYISRATTVLPAISNIRLAITGLLALFMIIGFVDHSSSSTLNTNPNEYFFTLFLNILSFVILAFFIPLLIHSIIFWVLENDFLRYLRPNKLSDFNIDDLMLLELVSDDIVHSSVEQLGMDATKITPPPMGYRPKQRIRAI